MGLFNLLKKNTGKIQKLAEDNADKIADGVDKATNAIDKKTGGKYTDKLNKVDDAVEKALDKNKGDDPTAPATGPR